MTAGIFLGMRPAGWRVLDMSNEIPTVNLLTTERRCEQHNLVGGHNNARDVVTNVTERKCGTQLEPG